MTERLNITGKTFDWRVGEHDSFSLATGDDLDEGISTKIDALTQALVYEMKACARGDFKVPGDFEEVVKLKIAKVALQEDQEAIFETLQKFVLHEYGLKIQLTESLAEIFSDLGWLKISTAPKENRVKKQSFEDFRQKSRIDKFKQSFPNWRSIFNG